MKLLVNSMTACALLLFASYIVLTGQTIYNVVNKKNIERDIIAARSDIAGLENNLFSQYNSVSNDTLSEHGFVKYNNEVYVSGDSTFVFNR